LNQPIHCNITIKYANLIMRDHRVHGVRIMPGVTFLDMLYRILKARGIDLNGVQFTDVVFSRPVETTETYDRRLQFSLVPGDAFWKIDVTSVPIRDGVVLDEGADAHLQCRMRSVNPPSLSNVALNDLRARAAKTVPADAMYAHIRTANIVHGPFMQASGKLHLGEDFVLAELALSDLGKAHGAQHILHPALLDASTIVPAMLPKQAVFEASSISDDQRPYIPLYTGRFYAARPFPDEVVVYLKAPEKKLTNDDLIHYNYRILDRDGGFLAEFTKFTEKKIRQTGLITNLTRNITQPQNRSAAAKPIEHSPSTELGETSHAALTALVNKYLGEGAGELDGDQGFYDLGLDSTQLLSLGSDLEQGLGETLYPTVLFEHNSLDQLAAYLAEHHGQAYARWAGQQNAKPAEAHQGSSLLESLRKLAAGILDRRPETLPTDLDFYELGLDSTQLLTLGTELQDRLGEELYPTLLFEQNTLELLADYLATNHAGATARLAPAHSDVPKQQSPLIATLAKRVGRILQADPATLDTQTSFYDLGLDSTQLLDLATQLEEQAGESLYPTLLFEHDTLEALSQFFRTQMPQVAKRLGTQTVKQASVEAPIAKELTVCTPIWQDAPANPVENAVTPGVVLWLDHFHSGSGVWVRDWFARHYPQSTLLCVGLGDRFAKIDHHRYQLNPATPQDFRKLIQHLIDADLCPTHLVQGWAEPEFNVERVPGQLATGFYSFFHLAQALLQHKASGSFRMTFLHRGTQPHPLHEAVAGLMRTVRIEHPKAHFQFLHLPIAANSDDRDWPDAIAREWQADLNDVWVSYHQGRRRIPGYREELVSATPERLESEGPYLITGGTGGLGLHFARHLIDRGARKLVLCGRSSLDQRKRDQIAALEALGAQVRYEVTDIANREDVVRTVEAIRQDMGPLRGIIHTAGILRDALFLRKTREELEQVLAAKVQGSLNLDAATQQEPLQFFALFSSTASTFGNLGQADYAYANGFIDRFAAWRDQQVSAGQRTGRSFAINWPFWAEGGMRLGEQTRQTLRSAGLIPLEVEAGLRAWDTALQGRSPQWVVLQGETSRIRKHLGVQPPQAPAQTTPPLATPAASSPSERRLDEAPVAIIGLAGRYPKSPDLERFWEALAQGRNCIEVIPEDRWQAELTYREGDEAHPGSQWGGFLEHIDHFDPLLFGISPREADFIDPQERLFLQTVWQLFENAGYPRQRLNTYQDRHNLGVGVFAGAMFHHYPWLAADKLTGVKISANSHWSIANRVSYCFDLFGPSMAVNTACSASLTAVHLACESLRRGECTMAVAGGVNLNLHYGKYLGLEEGQLLSREPANRSLGNGDGYVPSEGVGAVLLKPLDQAQRDGDRILAVVRGGMANHGGRKNAYGVPNGVRQEGLIRQTLKRLELAPGDIDYVECAANGSKLGDLMEVTALQRVFGNAGRQNLPIGTVKSNMGHAEPASGICQLTKVILQLQHRTLVPTLHTQPPHEQIDWSKLALKPQTKTEPWPTPADALGRPRPRRALVNSFGAGSANTSLVVEEWPQAVLQREPWQDETLVVISARTDQQRRAHAGHLAEFLKRHSQIDLRDLAWTLLHGRNGLEARAAFLVRDLTTLAEDLAAFASGEPPASLVADAVLKRVPTRFAAKPEVEKLVAAADWRGLAALWAEGSNLTPGSLPQDRDARLIDLPNYPFAAKRYWLKSLPQNTETVQIHDEDQTISAEGANQTIEEALTQWLCGLLNLDTDELDADRSLFDYGFDSLVATRLLNRIEAAWPVQLDRETYHQSETLTEIAALLAKVVGEGGVSLKQLGQGLEPEDGLVAPTPKPETPFALSEGQRALWTIAQLAPENYAYNVPLAYWVDSTVEVGALGRALAAVYRQHPALHTMMDSDGAHPQQWFAAGKPPTLQIQDLGDADDEAMLAALNASAHQPLQLEKDGTMRAQYFTRSQGQAALLITVHHIVFDGVSLPIFQRDLETAYRAAKQGEQPRLPQPKAHYADFVAWQKAMLESPKAAEHRAFWLETFSGDLAPLELPLDFARSATPSYRGSTVESHLKTATGKALKAWAKREKVSLFTVTMALVKTLLFRYTNQTDIRIGTPISGRPSLRFEEVIGYFMNMVVLRDKLDAGQSFKALVQQVRHTVNRAFAHSEYPLTTIQRDLTRERGQSPGALFEVGFYFQNWFQENQAEEALLSQPIPEIHQEGEFDLTFEILETAEDVVVFLKYNPDLFERTTIERMAGHLENLAESAMAEPERGLSNLALLNEVERQKLLAPPEPAFAATEIATPVHELIRLQAQKSPDAIAIGDPDAPLTYAELDAKASQLAGYLSAQGVGRGHLVGVFLERGPQMLVGLLGILKSGAAYVPLDPVYPPDRLGYMLEDSGARRVVSESALADKLAGLDIEVTTLDSDRSAIARAEPQPGLPSEPGQLAYIIYTSGSTGKPKGVAVFHKGLTNFLLSMQQQPGFGPQDRLLAVTTLCFDIAGLEMFLPLISGGQVHIADEETTKDGIALAARLDQGDITVMQATPATWKMLVAAEWQPKQAMKILCGGEAMNPELAEALCERSDQVWNMFGPTETTIWSTIQHIRKGEPVTIGKAIANTSVYVLDTQMRVVPFGIPGELFIGGDGVAKGYHNRPDLTESRFVPNPFDVTDRSKLYRTGDLVKMAPSGTLVYLGRIDQQVKVNGFRIELGEIESALLRIDGIDQAAVVLREESSGRSRLTAFLQTGEGFAMSFGELATVLQGWLPSYMIPTNVHVVSHYPMTLNRKVDRKTLSKAPLSQLQSKFGCQGLVTERQDGPEPVEPEETRPQKPAQDFQGWLGERLAAIAAEILELQDQSLERNTPLATYGFDSILFTELSVAIRREWQHKIAPSTFYRITTLDALAKHLAPDLGSEIRRRYEEEAEATPARSAAASPVKPTVQSSQPLAVPETQSEAIAPPETSSSPAKASPAKGTEQDPLLETLRQWVGELLNLSPSDVAIDHNLMDYGLDSNGFAELRMMIEEHWQIKVAASLVFNGETIAGIAEALRPLVPAADHRLPATDSSNEALENLLDQVASGSLSPEQASAAVTGENAEPEPSQGDLDTLFDQLERGEISPEQASELMAGAETSQDETGDLENLLAKLEEGEVSPEQALAIFEDQSTSGS